MDTYILCNVMYMLHNINVFLTMSESRYELSLFKRFFGIKRLPVILGFESA